MENENELARKKNQLYQIYMHEANLNVEVAKRAVVEYSNSSKLPCTVLTLPALPFQTELQEKLAEEEGKHSQFEQEIEDMNKKYQEEVAEYKVC